MTLQKIIETIPDVEIRSYSGRGMNGRNCPGVVTRDVATFCFQLGKRIAEWNFWNQHDVVEDVEIASDSMGREYIVYFPYEKFEIEGEEDEEDEEEFI